MRLGAFWEASRQGENVGSDLSARNGEDIGQGSIDTGTVYKFVLYSPGDVDLHVHIEDGNLDSTI